MGKRAATAVHWLYREDEDPEAELQNADPDFRRLSCELNVADWSYTEREKGCYDTWEACRRFHLQGSKKKLSARQHDILEGLLTFRRAKDLEPLMRVLKSY
jgi:hypothetical protein